MPLARRFASNSAVITSLASARTSPVSGVDLGPRKDATLKNSGGTIEPLDPRLLQLADMPRGDAPAGLDHNLLADQDVESDGLTAQALGHQCSSIPSLPK